MSRRNFLRKLGVGVAAIPLAKLSKANYPTRNNKPLIRFGVLLPDSTKYPVLANNFVDGLRLILDTYRSFQKHDIELVIEKYNANNKDLTKQATRLTDLHQVDVMTGIVSHYELNKLAPILEAKEVLFIENTIGEVVQLAPESECVFRNSFHMWNASFISGQWAAKTYGKRGLIASSFYDCGFNSHIAFQAGFQAAGGEIIKQVITDMPNQDGRTALQNAIKNDHPDFVFAQYSGIEAISFVHQYRQLAITTPLIGSGLLCTDNNLNGQLANANGVKSHATWTRTLDTSKNKTFVETFEEANQRYTDVFALLGYETGMMLNAALKSCGQSPTTQELIDSFATLSIDSPRGTLTMKNQEISCPVYLKQVKQKANYFLEYTDLQTQLIDHSLPEINALKATIQSGWSNVYMC